MRKVLLAGLVFAGAVGFLVAGRAAEPASAKASGCLWSAAQDAVQAAPQNHRVILENDKVRVLDVTVPPRTKENIHAHCWPSVLYVTEAGKYVDYDINGKVLFDRNEFIAKLIDLFIVVAANEIVPPVVQSPAHEMRGFHD